MSARYEITSDQWGEPLINGSRAIMWSDTALINAIRQQSADIAELRAELAAVTAERDSVRRNARDLTECAMKTIPADWRPGYAWTDDCVMNVLAEYVIELRKRAERAEARLTAIEAAPTVARVVEVDDRDFASGPHRTLVYCNDELPKHGSELISRPAKD